MNDADHVAEERPVAPGSRHVSIRVPTVLFDQLESVAADRGETVSHCARRILTEGLAPPRRTAIDDAIAALMLVRHHFIADAPVAPVQIEPAQAVESRTVNILNAKTDLQRLIDEVSRGVEIIITHAGAQRARLVPVDSSHQSAQRSG